MPRPARGVPQVIASPLPVRGGVNATRLRLPDAGSWPSVLDYVQERFPHVDPSSLRARFEAGEVVGRGGDALTVDTPLGEHTFIWYYRDLPEETRLPGEIVIMHRDDELLVVDKPHFLPTTPGGRYVTESALVRLRVLLDLPDLVPIHRLDRATAGVLLFSTNPATRGRYQVLFAERKIHKEYVALAPVDPALALPTTVRNRLASSRSTLRVWQEEGEPNAETRVELVDERCGLGRYRLTPHTGRTHQLRVHLGGLGIGILHDRLYPTLLPEAPDDFARPLQLLAQTITFTDPLSNKERQFSSDRELACWDASQHGAPDPQLTPS